MIIFYDGNYIKPDGLDFSISDLHIRYGFGFFETLLYDGERIMFLDDHVERLMRSCREFGLNGEKFDYDLVFGKLLDENGLLGRTCRLNIYHVAKNFKEYKSIAAVWRFTPPDKDKVFRLCVYPHVHDSYMNRYKTVSYAHFILAKKYAQERGFDDAVLVDSSGNYLETSSASLVAYDGEQYVIPDSHNKLPSISLKRFLADKKVSKNIINNENIKNYKNIYITNSLMGERIAEIFPLC
jgi:4-amino-4-deoxychorismate lyase